MIYNRFHLPKENHMNSLYMNSLHIVL